MLLTYRTQVRVVGQMADGNSGGDIAALISLDRKRTPLPLAISPARGSFGV
jgi:hypothetical protein